MAHQVEKMVFTGRKPWWYGNQHQGAAVGVDLGENAITSEVAMKEAGLDWQVTKARAGWLDPSAQTIDGAPVWRPAEGEVFLLRDSDRSVLGRATDDYQPFQNAEAFRFLDGLVEDGSLLYHTAGSLEMGKRVWILAQTPESWTIRRRSGDLNHHHAFLLVMLGHDGKTGITIMPTDIRAECANTCGFADTKAQAENLILRVAHSGDVAGKMEFAARAIEQLGAQSLERQKILQELAQLSMDTDSFIDLATETFLKLTGSEEEIREAADLWYEKATPLSKTKLENKVAEVTKLFTGGIGAEGNSAYDAVQAFTQYFDHFDIGKTRDQIEAGKRAAKAVKSSWLGAGAERKRLVWKRLAERVRR